MILAMSLCKPWWWAQTSRCSLARGHVPLSYCVYNLTMQRMLFLCVRESSSKLDIRWTHGGHVFTRVCVPPDPCRHFLSRGSSRTIQSAPWRRNPQMESGRDKGKVVDRQVHKVLIYTVIRFLWVSAKYGTCTVVSVNGTQVEDKMRTFKGECAQFRVNRCPVYTHDVASAKFSTNSQETDNSVRRVPQCMSPRRNWDSPTPLSPASVPLPPLPGGGGGGANSDDWRKT